MTFIEKLLTLAKSRGSKVHTIKSQFSISTNFLLLKETCSDGWVDRREIGEHGGCYLFANDRKGVKCKRLV